MLITSLVFSALLLAIIIHPGRSSKIPLTTVVVSSIALWLASFFVATGSVAVALQAFLLIVVAVVCKVAGWQARRFVALSCLASLAAYGVVGGYALHEVSQLRERNPYISMEARLPPYDTLVRPLPELTLGRLDVLEAVIDNRVSRTWMEDLRIKQLEQLHEHTVLAFANRPGFGVARMTATSQFALQRGLPPAKPIPQPGTRISFIWSTGVLEEASPNWKKEDFEKNWLMHTDSIVDFVNLPGFGYFKDRQHVAGFQAHHFRQAPASVGWVLRSVDLVGLVLHDKPAVYVTDEVPRMEELRSAATRPLDDFEAIGLAALREGDDLFMRETPEGRRLLGPIRSTRQCVGCHAGGRGDLLGAFSYTLTRD